jgi:hypothetical protein
MTHERRFCQRDADLMSRPTQMTRSEHTAIFVSIEGVTANHSGFERGGHLM